MAEHSVADKGGELRPADGPAQVFLARARQLAADPPEPGWDGVFERTSK